MLVKDNGFNYNYIYTKEHPTSLVTESYHKFLINLSYVNLDNKYKVIQLTSTLAAEGKTTFLTNMAYLLAQKDKKVLLIDLDLRKPKLHRVFDFPNEQGLTDYLSGNLPLDKVIKPCARNFGPKCVDVIVSGDRTSAVVPILESQKLKDMIDLLKASYDYIILDSPPVIAVADALYISKLADGVLFLIGQKQDAKKAVVKEAIETLRKNQTPIIGICLIQVDFKDSVYGYTYGYQSGYISDEKDDH